MSVQRRKLERVEAMWDHEGVDHVDAFARIYQHYMSRITSNSTNTLLESLVACDYCQQLGRMDDFVGGCKSCGAPKSVDTGDWLYADGSRGRNYHYEQMCTS